MLLLKDFSADMLPNDCTTVQFIECDLATAKALLNDGFESAIYFDSDAKSLSQALGIEVKANIIPVSIPPRIERNKPWLAVIGRFTLDNGGSYRWFTVDVK